MYHKLIVYQKSFALTKKIYGFLGKFPKDELFGLISQIKRSSVSIPSNIAEGSKYPSKSRIHFSRIALGSAAELQTQLELACALKYLGEEEYKKVEIEIIEITKMLYGLIKSCRE